MLAQDAEKPGSLILDWQEYKNGKLVHEQSQQLDSQQPQMNYLNVLQWVKGLETNGGMLYNGLLLNNKKNKLI